MNENMTPAVRRRLRALGEDIRTARRKRRITQVDLAARMGVAVTTVQRMEAGDPGLSIGTLAMALLAFGNVERLSSILPEESDDIGLWIDRENLPQRVRKRNAESRGHGGQPPYVRTREGVAF
ncbi:MAG: helix-turn-helix transcriptional regulator [Gammaproteobacteria bacterium]|nr:helix-turn-helix transcriptional regulator [Gammaproteobacteria bacterium]